MLAIVVACEIFHSYIFGKKFTVESDHKKLWNDSFEESNSCTPKRMLLVIHGYDMTINTNLELKCSLLTQCQDSVPYPVNNRWTYRKCAWCNSLMQDWTPSDKTPHQILNFPLFEKPFTLDGLKKQKRVPAHLRKYWLKLQRSDLDWRPALRNGQKYIYRSPPNCTLLDFQL